jgi:hypothetical protein
MLLPIELYQTTDDTTQPSPSPPLNRQLTTILIPTPPNFQHTTIRTILP